MCCKHVRGTLLLEGLFYMSCIEALHHLKGTRCQELHLCWKQLKVSCHNNRDMCCLSTMSGMFMHDTFCTDMQDFGTVALLVWYHCAEYKGRVD